MAITFVIVLFLTEMVITRNHAVGQVPGQVEMNPTSLPELFKPSRDLGNHKKPKVLEIKIVRETKIFNGYVNFGTGDPADSAVDQHVYRDTAGIGKHLANLSACRSTGSRKFSGSSMQQKLETFQI